MFIVALSVAALGLVLGLAALVLACRQTAADVSPGLAAWRAAQRGLPLGGCVSITVAQLLGRPVTDPRLSAAAHVRGAYALPAARRMAGPDSPLQRNRWLLVALSLVQAPLLLGMAADGDAGAWIRLSCWCGIAAMAARGPQLHAASVQRLERSLAGTPGAATSAGYQRTYAS